MLHIHSVCGYHTQSLRGIYISSDDPGFASLLISDLTLKTDIQVSLNSFAASHIMQSVFVRETSR